MKNIISFLPISLLLSLLASCGSGSGNISSTPGDTIAIRHAVNLTMVDHGDYVSATVRNPWDTLRSLQTYILIDSGAALPKGLTNEVVVRVPLRRAVVYTTVHNSLVDELGAIDAVAGVCDATYITNANTKSRLASGAITDCGQSMAPNLEKIVMLGPDALLLSAFENSSDHNKVAQLGVPIIDCADYMETSPLGRAEWMRFYGRLFGKGELADSLFDATEREYMATKALAANATTRPSMIFDRIYGQAWSVPGATSTAGRIIEDAGGRNPFDEYKQSGSAMLAPEEVLYKGGDADIWLIRYDGDRQLTLTDLGKDNAIYSQFRPYREGRVYGCNTQKSTYFDDVAFHPQWLLMEYAAILHPELGLNPSHRYFTLLPN